MRRLLPLVLLAGCFDPPVEGARTVVSEVTDYSFLAGPRDKVDLLFVIDDSGSMAPKQDELKARLPEFIQKLEQIGASGKKASYHIGVVTSDLPAGDVCGATREDGKPRFRGALVDLGAAAAASCQRLSDGKRYIDYDQRTGRSNLPPGQDLATTFQCLASVGTKGCGFEQPLEAAYKVLHDGLPENAGFLRPDAILAVIILADEDDCSAPGDSAIYRRDNPQVGALDSFRCFQHGVRCGDPAMSIPDGPGAYSTCTPATTAEGGKLWDLERYVNLFRLPVLAGGLKSDPARNLLVVGIVGDQREPVRVGLFRQNTTPHQSCPSYAPTPVGQGCVWQTDHTCQSTRDPNWVGDAAVRIRALVGALPTITKQSRLTSVCENTYAPALDAVADYIQTVSGFACVDKPFTTPDDPQCAVVENHADGTQEHIPDCGRANGHLPCWRAVEKSECPAIYNPISGRDQRASIVIDRGGAMPRTGSNVDIRCATIADNTIM